MTDNERMWAEEQGDVDKAPADEAGLRSVGISPGGIDADLENAELPAETFYAINEGDNAGWPYIYYDPAQHKKIVSPEYGGDGKKEHTTHILVQIILNMNRKEDLQVVLTWNRTWDTLSDKMTKVSTEG